MVAEVRCDGRLVDSVRDANSWELGAVFVFDTLSRCLVSLLVVQLTSIAHLHTLLQFFMQTQPIIIHMHHVSPCILTHDPLC